VKSERSNRARSTPIAFCRALDKRGRASLSHRGCKHMTAIVDIIGREILDSRGNPTV
jgi:hypothetical protein